jgi:hypothetical protein
MTPNTPVDSDAANCGRAGHRRAVGRGNKMTQTQIQTLMLILVAVGAGVVTSLGSKRRLDQYWTRNCTGSEWRKQFPQASKDAIREFLQCFVKGFAFNSKKRLKFNPDDKIMDVYRALYPTEGWPDALELETFSIYLEKKYRLDLASVFNEDLTLGQIFKMTTETNLNQNARLHKINPN